MNKYLRIDSPSFHRIKTATTIRLQFDFKAFWIKILLPVEILLIINRSLLCSCVSFYFREFQSLSLNTKERERKSKVCHFFLFTGRKRIKKHKFYNDKNFSGLIEFGITNILFPEKFSYSFGFKKQRRCFPNWLKSRQHCHRMPSNWYVLINASVMVDGFRPALEIIAAMFSHRTINSNRTTS